MSQRRTGDERRPGVTPSQVRRRRDEGWSAEYAAMLEKDRRREEAYLARSFWQRLTADADRSAIVVWLLLLPFWLLWSALGRILRRARTLSRLRS